MAYDRSGIFVCCVCVYTCIWNGLSQIGLLLTYDAEDLADEEERTLGSGTDDRYYLIHIALAGQQERTKKGVSNFRNGS